MKTTAFYSYKGGVGRSLFVASLALFLARFGGKKVLAVDFDFEAPGLHYKFKTFEAPEVSTFKVPTIESGLVDTLHDYLYAPNPPKSLPILKLWEEPSGGSLLFYPAGAAPSTRYWNKLGQLDFHALVRDEDNVGTMLFREVLEHIREEFAPDIVLVDARTGVSDIGGAATQIWAEQAFCMTLDEMEHLEGTRAVMRGLARRERLDGQGLIQVVPVVSRMHTRYGSPEEQALRERIRGFLNEAGPSVEETLSITSPDDIVVLHNDDEVYRTGRVLLRELMRGGKDHPSRLVADYYDVGIGRGFLDADDALRAMTRLFSEEVKPYLGRETV